MTKSCDGIFNCFLEVSNNHNGFESFVKETLQMMIQFYLMDYNCTFRVNITLSSWRNVFSICFRRFLFLFDGFFAGRGIGIIRTCVSCGNYHVTMSCAFYSFRKCHVPIMI
jgi:hypothetical protein